MVGQNHNGYQGVGIYYIAIYNRILCNVGIICREEILLEYNNLMKCWVYIIYTIVICDTTYIMKIMKGLNSMALNI